jgi:hypothetical protein
MEQLKGGLFITAKEISLVTGLHIRNAQKEHQQIRDTFGRKGRKLTIRQFCLYNELDYEEVVAFLNQYR